MQRIASATIFSFTAVFMSSLAFAGDALTIRDIAPEKALLVVGADDLHGTIDRLGTTSFGKLWNDPVMAEQVKKFKDGFEKGVKDAAEKAGIERDSVTWPSSAGLAVMATIDEELGLPTPQFMFFCDWSADAEKATKWIDSMISSMEKDAKDAGGTVKTEEIRGRRVLVMPFGAAKKGDAKKDADGDEDEDEGPFGTPDFAPKQVCIVSDKGRMLAASSTETMDTMLQRVDGDHAKSIGESATFKGATELSGGTQDIYAVLATEQAKPLLAAMPQIMLVEPIIKRFFGDIKAWSFGVHAKDGVFETAQGIYVPGGKVGLLSLIDMASEPKPAPAIVPSDALSYGRMNVRFDKIVSMLDEVIGGLPEDQAEMIKPQIDMYRPAMTAAFAALGPEMHIWGTEPDAADPMSAGATVTAIAMKNDKASAAAVSDFINLLPLGLQPRDFNGMTILSDEFSPIALGIGGGYLVIGQVKQVEQALRSVDAKGEAGLAGDAQYAAAVKAMSKDPVVATVWWNTPRMMESAGRTMKAAAAQIEAMGGGEDAEIPGVGLGVKDVFSFYDLLKPDVVKRCFGDTVLDFKATNAGFSTSLRALPGTGK